jgi:hypothetical protein
MDRQASLDMPLTVGAQGKAVRRGGPFFFVMALIMLTLVVIGFSPTFYLRGIVKAPVPPGPITPYLIVHGVVMTCWYGLFCVQAFLAMTGRVGWHRQLGLVGAVLALAVLVMGVYVPLHLPARLAGLGVPIEQQLKVGLHGVVIGNLVSMVSFAGLVLAALLLRARRPWHGRLLYATFVLTIAPAFGSAGRRMLDVLISAVFPPWLPVTLLFVLFAFMALAVHDVRTIRRVHPATWVGAGVYVVTLVLVIVLVPVPAMQHWYLSLA